MAVIETPEEITKRIKRNMNSWEAPSNTQDNIAEAVGKRNISNPGRNSNTDRSRA
jgi:hypothetical protein